jgi:hypothetical protein
MRYRVKGVNRTTGIEVSRTFEAGNEELANAMAQPTMVVESIRLEGGGGRDDDAPAAVLPYQTAIAMNTTPTYGSIQIGVSVLRVFSVLCYIAAALFFLGTFAAFNSANTIGAVASVSMAFYSAAMGAIIGLLAGIGEAVRDIAINSFRK